MLSEVPEGPRATIVEAVFQVIQDKDSTDVKKVKVCKENHPLKVFKTPKLRL